MSFSKFHLSCRNLIMTSIIHYSTCRFHIYIDKDFFYVIFFQAILTVFVSTKMSKLKTMRVL